MNDNYLLYDKICKLIDESKTLLHTSFYGSQLVITNSNAEELKRKICELLADYTNPR